MNKRYWFFFIFVFGVLNFGCSPKVAPPPDSLEGWRYIFSVEPVTDTVPVPENPFDTLTPQRIDE